MANTLKFGNENWATKKDSILAYNDENANFKPLPFVTSRASTATRVNKAGLLETVGVGIPRVDYLGNTKGAYLLEPQSTNLIAQSESFGNSYWTKSGASIQGDASTVGSEQVVNGDFATTSNWVLAGESVISGGRGIVYSSAGAFSNIKQLVNLTVGKNYILKFDILTETSGYIKIGSSNGGSDITANVSSVGSYTYHFNAVDTLISFARGGSITHIYIDNVSIKEVQGFASPSADSPLGAFKLVENVGLSDHRINSASQTLTANTYSGSFFAKKAERDVVQIFPNGSFDSNAYANFDLTNGIVSASTSTIAKIQALSDGWYKCSYTFLGTVSNTVPMYISIMTSPTSAKSEDYTGDGTSGVYIFGAQLELGSYATSYIPTSGSQITKLVDTASQTVPDGIINSSEGVLYWEGNNLSESGSGGLISLNNGISNRVTLELDSGTVKARFIVGGVSIGIFNYTISTTNNLKIAITYKLNDFRLWVNGAQRVSSNSGTSFAVNTLNKTSFNRGDGGDIFYGKTKDLRVYNTALTDAELVTLTRI